CLSACPTPMRRRPAAALWRPWDRPRRVARIGRMLDLASLTCPQPSPHVAPRTPIPLSAPHPSPDMHMLPHAALRTTWRPYQAVSVSPPSRFHTTPSPAGPRHRRGASRRPRLLRGHRLGAYGQSACGGVGFGETPHGIWGDEK